MNLTPFKKKYPADRSIQRSPWAAGVAAAGSLALELAAEDLADLDRSLETHDAAWIIADAARADPGATALGNGSSWPARAPLAERSLPLHRTRFDSLCARAKHP